MAIDNDLSALLPEPPPPRPVRREAAIEQALQRFDARGGQTPLGPADTRQVRRPGWGRPQIAALASMALVLLVSLPIWWAERDRLDPIGPEASPIARASQGAAPEVGSAGRRQVAPSGASPIAPQPAEPASPAARVASPDAPAMAVDAAPAPAPLADPRAMQEAPGEASPGRAAARPRTAAAAAPVAVRARSEESIVVTGSRVARQDFSSSSPVVSLDEASSAGGDWHACTILDPRRDLDACRADPAARGGTGRASAHLADGLALAWQGELNRSIVAFGRAIRAAPDLSTGYLNRGLAYQSKGDLRRALADLNRAVEREPDSARGYYHRSLLHRIRGDAARADADAERATDLDPSYQAVLP